LYEVAGAAAAGVEVGGSRGRVGLGGLVCRIGSLGGRLGFEVTGGFGGIYNVLLAIVVACAPATYFLVDLSHDCC